MTIPLSILDLAPIAPGQSPRDSFAASVPNCSAMVSGEWFGSMMPPDPSRMLSVWAAMCPINTLVADDAIVGMLWCSAYQTRV
jgi:hypothetical protein